MKKPETSDVGVKFIGVKFNTIARSFSHSEKSNQIKFICHK